MTNDEINIAIAEACGWKFHDEHLVKPDGTVIDCEFLTEQGVEDQYPNYCADLNAMAEAEKQLVLSASRVSLPRSAACNEANQYFYYLQRICGDWHPIHATSRQRAEAFLKTLCLWND